MWLTKSDITARKCTIFVNIMALLLVTVRVVGSELEHYQLFDIIFELWIVDIIFDSCIVGSLCFKSR